MQALTWQGPREVRVEQVPDPHRESGTDALVRVTSSAICGSDLHPPARAPQGYDQFQRTTGGTSKVLLETG